MCVCVCVRLCVSYVKVSHAKVCMRAIIGIGGIILGCIFKVMFICWHSILVVAHSLRVL